MPLTYRRAFALGDNPFGPTRPLPGITKYGVMQMLESFPLRIHDEPKLLGLYCAHAGPFHQHTTRFLQEIATSGYSVSPPSAGLRSWIFLISGYKGTGKTTLAHVMIHLLQKCKLESAWRVFGLPSNDFSSSTDQIAEINKLQERIERDTSTGDYCCVLLDDLVSGAESRALDLFDKLIYEEKIVFLFISTSDLQILNRGQDNSRHQITQFKMRELTSLDAVAFVKHRMVLFRKPKLPSLSNYNLFPFDEADIKGAVESGILREREDGEGRITLRQLNVILHKSLINRMVELDPDFNIAKMPESGIPNYIISLVKYYEQMVA